MSELINNMLELMSPETVKVFKDLNFKSSSELATEELDNLEGELANIKLNAYEREIDARLAMEEKELALYKNLNKTLSEELDVASKLLKCFEPPTSNPVALLRTKNELIKKKTDEKATFNYIDVCDMVDLHEEIVKKEVQAKELETRTYKYMGFPPDITKAKEALRVLKSEIERLEASLNHDLEEEVANYVS